jgi:hypothetical protein
MLVFIYWLWLIFKYFQWPFGDPNVEYGGLSLFVCTLPWSALGQFIPLPVSAALADSMHFSISDAVSLLTLVGLCGGLNGYILLRGLRISEPRRLWYMFVVAMLLLAAIAQITVDRRAQLALEHHRPAGVLKAAVAIPHLASWYWPQSMLAGPGVAGPYWQWCESKAVDGTTYCKVWSLYGDVWYDEDFAPYDGGPAPSAADLKIVERNSSPHYVALANGRFLVPGSRRAEFTRILDWRTGKTKSSGADTAAEPGSDQ